MWYSKHSQKHTAGELIDPRGKPVSLTSLGKCNFILYAKYVVFYLQKIIRLTTHQ